VAHVNKQIRDAFKARIATVEAVGTVDSNRGADLLEADLPAVVVETGRDVVEPGSKPYKGAAALERRTVEVTAVIVAEADAALDDTLDALRSSIETAVRSDDTLGGIATEVRHTGGELDVGADEEGERWFAFYALGWEVVVWTHEGAPETAVVS
jgi:hypothetical protein